MARTLRALMLSGAGTRCLAALGALALLAGCGSRVGEASPSADGGRDGPQPFDFAPPIPTDGNRSEVVNISPDAACVTQTARAERLPLDLYLMLDSSYSMFDPTQGGQNKWDAVRMALGMFIMDPRLAGYGLGLQYFPLVRSEIPEDCFMDPMCAAFGPCLRARTCSPGTTVQLCDRDADCSVGQTCVLIGGCSASDSLCTPVGGSCAGAIGNRCEEIPGYCDKRDLCEADAYATPSVPIAALPGAAAAISASLAARKPVGRTPLGPALAGALKHAQDRMKANPARKVAVVLASDGLPVECAPADINGVAVLAEAANRGTPSVATFAVGVVSPAEAQGAIRNLGLIATRGGTGTPFVITTNKNVTQELLTALDAIRTTTLGCEYRLPAPPAGTLDYSRVNVQYTAGNGQARTIANVADKAACDAGRGGWYYDVAPAGGNKPASIIVCESTCSELRGDAQGRVDIVLGCQTVVD